MKKKVLFIKGLLKIEGKKGSWYFLIFYLLYPVLQLIFLVYPQICPGLSPEVPDASLK